ncbi:C-C motif chemokine 21 [Willisornis vidua]|uniref:C-C motif chemokine n=1 Tax=Willisornis vidua TaxID=1566151 RepID=A0ABQ9DR82_9PASS|nr:C-C motif chemokine 21 [Willisornis vidua]
MALRLLLPLLMLAATLFIAQAQGIGSSASDCCLGHSQKTIPRDMVTSYTHQGPESGCLLRAVVFITKKGRKICASPTKPDVLKVMKYVDKVKNDRNKKKGQPQRSGGKPKQRRRQRV